MISFRLLQNTGKKEASRTYRDEFNRLQEIKRKSQRAMLLKGDGDRALREGRLEEAVKVLKECLALDPTAGDAAHLLGATLAQQGKMQKP